MYEQLFLRESICSFLEVNLFYFCIKCFCLLMRFSGNNVNNWIFFMLMIILQTCCSVCSKQKKESVVFLDVQRPVKCQTTEMWKQQQVCFFGFMKNTFSWVTETNQSNQTDEQNKKKNRCVVKLCSNSNFPQIQFVTKRDVVTKKFRLFVSLL